MEPTLSDKSIALQMADPSVFLVMLWICDTEENNISVFNCKFYVMITIRTSSSQKTTIAETHLNRRNIEII